MSASPPDPEFDTNLASVVRLRDFVPTDHQRVILNPCLAVAAMTGWFWAFWLLMTAQGTLLALPMLALVPLAPRLIHYHCLDCGQTGSNSRRRWHACAGVVARGQGRRGARTWLPPVWLQGAIWAYFILSAVILFAVLANWSTE